MTVVAIAFAVALVAIGGLWLLAHPIGLLDYPCGRKQHDAPTPTIGGLAMFVALGVTLLLEQRVFGEVKLLLGASTALVLLGLFDDKKGLPVSLRMLSQVLVALVVIVGAGGMISHLGGLFGSDIYLGLFAIPFSVIAFVGGINAMNMIDGADGMAGCMAIITVIGSMLLFAVEGEGAPFMVSLALIGVLSAFLLFNSRLFLSRARVFMGDAGSMWLGLVLGWFMAQLTTGKVMAEPPVVMWLFGIPLLDTVTVMMRRLQRGSSPFNGDRTHIHHVLERAGFSSGQAVFLLCLVQASLVGMGVALHQLHASAAVVFWGFMSLLACYYYLLRHCWRFARKLRKLHLHPVCVFLFGAKGLR